MPMVISDSVKGTVKTARSGCISLNYMPRCPTKGEWGRNWRINSAPEGSALPGVLMAAYFPSVRTCTPACCSSSFITAV